MQSNIANNNFSLTVCSDLPNIFRSGDLKKILLTSHSLLRLLFQRRKNRNKEEVTEYVAYSFSRYYARIRQKSIPIYLIFQGVFVYCVEITRLCTYGTFKCDQINSFQCKNTDIMQLLLLRGKLFVFSYNFPKYFLFFRYGIHYNSMLSTVLSDFRQNVLCLK